MPPANRFASIDALRGSIMILMAIDHTTAFIARQHGSEFWNGAIPVYTSPLAFLTRFVTHLCAPGFFFLMGAGVWCFAASRLQAGWSRSQVIRRTAFRGLVLLLLGQLLENPIIFLQSLLTPAPVPLSPAPLPLPNDGLPPVLYFITLSGLGAVLTVCAALLLLRPAFWLATSAAAVLATHALLPTTGKVGPAWFTFLLAPGLSQRVLATYPVIPWLAVAAFGMYCGHLWQHRPALRTRVGWLGGGLILLALTLRLAGGWGNIVPPRDHTWIEFLNNVKYPPSLVFWTLAIGLNLLLLAALQRVPTIWLARRSPLLVFGQTPLFFYLLHFYVLFGLDWTLFPTAAPLPVIYPVWLLLLALMYPLCLRYRDFKLQTPQESLWRLF